MRYDWREGAALSFRGEPVFDFTWEDNDAV